MLQAVRDSLVLVQTGVRSRTGLVVGDGTLVLTTADFLENERDEDTTLLSVLHHSGLFATGVVVGKDTSRDLAVISLLGGVGYPPADLSFEGLPAVAENVAMIGYPQSSVDLPGISRGVVTSLRLTSVANVWLIEADAPVSQEHGGGPLVSLQGEILGVVVNAVPLLQGGPVEGHGYALNMDEVWRLIAELS